MNTTLCTLDDWRLYFERVSEGKGEIRAGLVHRACALYPFEVDSITGAIRLLSVLAENQIITDLKTRVAALEAATAPLAGLKKLWAAAYARRQASMAADIASQEIAGLPHDATWDLHQAIKAEDKALDELEVNHD